MRTSVASLIPPPVSFPFLPIPPFSQTASFGAARTVWLWRRRVASAVVSLTLRCGVAPKENLERHGGDALRWSSRRRKFGWTGTVDMLVEQWNCANGPGCGLAHSRLHKAQEAMERKGIKHGWDIPLTREADWLMWRSSVTGCMPANLAGPAHGPRLLARHGTKQARDGPKHALCHIWAWPVARRAGTTRPSQIV
jgi:hypothetical protein